MDILLCEMQSLSDFNFSSMASNWLAAASQSEAMLENPC